MRRFALAAAIAAPALLAPAAARAHAGEAVGPADVWHHWTFDPLALVPLLLAHWLYGRGWLRLPERRRSKAAGASFVAGEVALFAALVSPIDALGETALSFHMVQHMLLVAAAPPMLLLGRPGLAFAAALPHGSAGRLLGSAALRPLARAAVWLSGLVPATLLHALALWLWHAPPLFEAALVNEAVHRLEHFCFFASALLFWLAVLRAGRTARTAAGAALAAFVTFVHSGMLGGLLSLAPVPLYPAYGDRPALWGLDLLTDQQLAGVIMWVPIGPVYMVAALWALARLLRQTGAIVGGRA